MYQRIIELANKQESIDLKELLELNYIPCNIGQYTPSSKAEADEKTIYFVTFPNEYQVTFKNLSKNEHSTKLFKIQEIKRGVKPLVLKYFLIPLIILLSLLCLKFYYASHLGNGEKHFEYKWSLDNKKLDVINKNTKKIKGAYKDRNYDNNWEKIYEYHNGKKVVEANDLNENGIIDEYIYFDLNGNLVGINTDYDQDGLIDTMKLVLENKEQLVFIDKNKNGAFELSK